MHKKVTLIFVSIVALLSLCLILLPSAYDDKDSNDVVYRNKGSVIAVDNTDLRANGLITTGTQVVSVVMQNGPYKSETLHAQNLLTGQLAFDKVFDIEDTVFVTITEKNDQIIFVDAVDHYRINGAFILVVIFTIALIGLGGWTGLKSILSFIFTILCIWKVLIPLFLAGYNPIWISTVAVSILTAVIIFLVAGLTKTGLVAFLGAISGVLLTCVLAISFGVIFKVNGYVLPFSEALLYTGFSTEQLTQIFFSGIFIASSGAVMDIAMDISVSLNELIEKKSDIGRLELFTSGIKISRAVIGTMTTTLLLAYSGGYMAMLMFFMTKGIPIINMLNYSFVAAEILKTMVGSFGLILVAPLTSVVGSMVFVKSKKYRISKKTFIGGSK